MTEETVFDWSRRTRTGLPEAVLAEPKSIAQLQAIIDAHRARGEPLLLTRVTDAQAEAIAADDLMQDRVGRTAILGPCPAPASGTVPIGIVTAGSSDMAVAREAEATARFLGHGATIHADRGVAGLWRLGAALDEIRRHRILIAVAGMEGALFSVLPGLVACPVIAVPSSVGYGVSAQGRTALDAALASCSPGLTVVNIDNGFGAACAAAKILSMHRQG
ncbi:nickel pincer cofactor biosynthesis protein LarB [Oceanomicrobium pacificus]|uniref:Nickel pincer cofactor biosynthesis protein LarB n=1 Tax=Oceanomicrobium pacificus TaxID=2692916 RepID=A0A6B0TVE7_9RHOB|nr:nickel pincer cofactor biosynthesis protein LarB [Oceanomicrobium pacificus]MXU65192.1 nickel pincer cofactor biosynthesis protein LarB [Oceanomicrobium pacificus]